MISRSRSSTELRFELPDDQLSVIDAVASASNTNRTAVVREILSEWTENKLHEATLIVRVTGVNPMLSERRRRTDG